MALILLEGLDRTGKSTVAQFYKEQGYEVLHMSAPPKELTSPGYTGPSYLDQMVELLSQAASRDIVLDRTHYGELIWPNIYNRKPHLQDEDYEILREIEESIGVQRILMHDPNIDAHWQRCVDNKEPLTKAQFLKARALYERMAEKYGFERKTLKDFVNVKEQPKVIQTQTPNDVTNSTGQTTTELSPAVSGSNVNSKSPELAKLEKANAINDVLEKRILKLKGPMYDELENEIRAFLRDKLGKIFGDGTNGDFSKEEIQVLKLFCKRLKDKETTK